MKKNRVIMHYDMDCFYASVEIRDNPQLKNKPLVVGRSIITTASYEARKYGIHSAMKIIDAKKLCPNLIIVPPNKDKYFQVSKQIKNLVLKITEKAEFIALDEAYLDISEIIEKFSSKEAFAKKFRERIKYHTNLSCSVGIGFNKLSAKLASNINKPSGQFIFYSPDQFVEYIEAKKISIIPGVGKKFSEILSLDSIYYVKDVYYYSLQTLCKKYGKSRGELLYSASRGIDYGEVEYNKPTHSIGNENTFRFPLITEFEINKELIYIFDRAYERLIKNEMLCKTIILKVKFSSGNSITRSKTLEFPTDSKEKLKENLNNLIENTQLESSVRLLGVSFSNLIKKSIRQLTLTIL